MHSDGGRCIYVGSVILVRFWPDHFMGKMLMLDRSVPIQSLSNVQDVMVVSTYLWLCH